MCVLNKDKNKMVAQSQSVSNGGVLSKIKKGFVTFLLTIAGVDYDKLGTSTKSEKVVYPALGFLMCLAALWTGTGLTIKLSSGLGLEWWASVLIFLFTTSFALMLEMVVVGTLKNGAKFFGNLGVRILLGVNLMLLQVIPVLVIVFSPNIEVYKNEQVLLQVAHAKELASKSQDIDRLTEENSKAKERLLAASSATINPPENSKITDVNNLLLMKNTEAMALSKEYSVNLDYVGQLRKDLSIARARYDFEEVPAIQRRIRAATSKVNEVQKSLAVVNAEKEQLTLQREELVAEYDKYLKEELRLAEENNKAKAAVLAIAAKEVDKVTQTTQNLAENASVSRFFNDIAVLVEIMKVNTSILYSSLFVIFVALLVDLIPVLTKLQLTKGVYARIMDDEEEVKIALTNLKKARVMNAVEKQKIIYEKQVVKVEQERAELHRQKAEMRVKAIKLDKALREIEGKGKKSLT
ncbi:MAG: hypothetical protein QG564_1128 [Campylobacterota bacterium]|nr:hypothetical protein [Campylobacterota bacterium]